MMPGKAKPDDPVCDEAGHVESGFGFFRHVRRSAKHDVNDVLDVMTMFPQQGRPAGERFASTSNFTQAAATLVR